MPASEILRRAKTKKHLAVVWAGLLFAVAATWVIGSRDNHVATATLSIGYTVTHHVWGFPLHTYLDHSTELEQYVRNQFDDPRCNSTVFVTSGKELRITCRGRDPRELRDRVETMVGAVLRRHQRLYDDFRNFHGKRYPLVRPDLDKQMAGGRYRSVGRNGVNSSYNSLPDSGMSRRRDEGRQRSQNTMTFLSPPGITVEKKAISMFMWGLLCLTALAFGAFVAILHAITDFLRVVHVEPQS